jgi:hypothetical protein
MMTVFDFLDRHPRAKWVGVLGGLALVSGLALAALVWFVTFEGQ